MSTICGTLRDLMLAVGANPKVAQEILGHANVTITLDSNRHAPVDGGRALGGPEDAAASWTV